MAFDARLLLQLTASLTNSLDLTTVSAPLPFSKQITLTEGTGLNAANKIWHDRRTITASATDSLDLAGSLTDPFGATITLARIKGLIVSADTGNTNNVVVTRPASNGVPLFSASSDACPVLPGGLFVWMAPNAAGITVTAGTGDLIDMVNSGAGSSVIYDVVIIGANA